MDWASFFICFTGWTLGGIVNGISGLGAGIFALPIVLLVTDIKTASLITCIICIPLPAILGWQFRHYYRMADLRLLLLGTIPGALLGGLLLGVIETFARAYISTELSTAIVFGVLIIVLLVKPAGLLGKKIQEKV